MTLSTKRSTNPILETLAFAQKWSDKYIVRRGSMILSERRHHVRNGEDQTRFQSFRHRTPC